MKYCCFRFDADTHVCVSRGIPRLAELGQELGVAFTFFVNMGRAFDPAITISKALRRVAKNERRAALPAGAKLGWRGSLEAALFNPRAGAFAPAALQAAVHGGHEVGLHGGRNHARWERSAHTWGEDFLESEIRWGLRSMAKSGIEDVRSFASPAWNSPRSLPRVLSRCGFEVFADILDAEQEEVGVSDGLLSVPTNITAAPGSAGYLESMRLRGLDQAAISRDFRRQLAAKKQLAVVYDHPFFAGIDGLAEVRALVQVAREEGFQVCTISAAARQLHGQKRRPAIV